MLDTIFHPFAHHSQYFPFLAQHCTQFSFILQTITHNSPSLYTLFSIYLHITAHFPYLFTLPHTIFLPLHTIEYYFFLLHITAHYFSSLCILFSFLLHSTRIIFILFSIPLHIFSFSLYTIEHYFPSFTHWRTLFSLFCYSLCIIFSFHLHTNAHKFPSLHSIFPYLCTLEHINFLPYAQYSTLISFYVHTITH